MKSATQQLYAHSSIGAPPIEGVEPFTGPCWLCAGTEVEAGVPVEKWNGASFTGQTRIKAPHGTHVCAPCVFFTSRTSPVPGRPPKEGKKFGGNFRNYSHLLDGGTYINASKGEKPAILTFLRGRKTGVWFGALADSGQKHVLPWAPLNPPGIGGTVLFDDTQVRLPRDASGWRIVDDMIALLTAGATKEEVSTGTYGSRAWQMCRGLIEAFEVTHSGQRGGAWFGLAIWLAQRDEEAVQERIAAEKEAKAKVAAKPARKAPRGVASGKTKGGGRGPRQVPGQAGDVPARAAGGVPEGGGEPAQALGADADAHPLGREDEREPGGVRDGAPAQPAPGQRGQLSLFGAA